MSRSRPRSIAIRTHEVRHVVARAQHRRQLVIFIIQQLFAANIGMVYLASNKSAIREVLHGPGPVIYGCYVLFSLWCLYRSSRQRLTTIDCMISIMLDYALYNLVMFDRSDAVLSEGIELSGSPLFTYVYLFIAMRSLHFK